MADQTPNTNTPPGSPADAAKPPGDVAPETMAVDAINSAQKAAQTILNETSSGSRPVQLPAFDKPGGGGPQASELELLDDVTLRVKIELGRTQMYVEDVLRLSANSVVELDKAAGDPVDIYVNDRHVARGEVLVLNESFCVRVSEIIQQSSAEDSK